MRKLLVMCILLQCILWNGITVSIAETCGVCQGNSDACFTDEAGAIYCNGILVSYPSSQKDTSYTVKPNTKIIDEGAFAENECLQEVIIPDGVVMIRAYAFEGCYSLSKVDLPDTLLIIDNRAFALCYALSEISLPPNLYCIGRQAFEDNWNLTTIALPSTLRFIGDEAFSHAELKEAYVFTFEVYYGYNIFSTDHLVPPDELHIHFPEEVLTEENGNIYEMLDDLSGIDAIRVSCDLKTD